MQIVQVEGWLTDEDYPVFPVGSKPKPLLVCPHGIVEPFLTGRHKYHSPGDLVVTVAQDGVSVKNEISNWRTWTSAAASGDQSSDARIAGNGRPAPSSLPIGEAGSLAPRIRGLHRFQWTASGLLRFCVVCTTVGDGWLGYV
jgi:hypothetical protein